MEDVLTETDELSRNLRAENDRGQIKDVSDVCDNLFNADPITSRAATWSASAASPMPVATSVGRRI
jgi:hypothetical protein